MDLLERFYSREDFHQSISFAKAMEGIGWSSIPIGQSRLAVRQLGPVSLSKMQRAHEIDFGKIQKVRSKLHIFRTIIEPNLEGEIVDAKKRRHAFSFTTPNGRKKATQLFIDAGFRSTNEHYAHSKTALIDLAPNFDKVIAKFPSKTRYNIKISQRPLNSYKVSRFDRLSKKDKGSFFLLHTQWSAEKKIFGFTNDFLSVVIGSFQTNGWMVQSSTDGTFSGGMLVLIHDRVAYYFYTCTSAKGKQAHVPSGLTFQALKLAKEQGADIFDFCSVFDERYPQEHPRWKGFTEFKSRFMPVNVYYPPSFSRWL